MKASREPSLPDWRIIDGIGPFFREVRTKRVNWSKVPFAAWERNGRLCPARAAQVLLDTRRLTGLVPRLCRRTPRYRRLDHLLFLRPLGWVHGWVGRFNPGWVPRFARKRAMGINSLFR